MRAILIMALVITTIVLAGCARIDKEVQTDTACSGNDLVKECTRKCQLSSVTNESYGYLGTKCVMDKLTCLCKRA